MSQSEQDYAHLIEGLSVDTSGHWTTWDWARVAPMTSYDFARLEEYRDSVVIAYRLYNRIGLEHARRMLGDAPRDTRLLDADGGTGRKAIPLAQEGLTDINVLDIAPGWLRLADEKARRAGVRDRLELVQGDVRDMRDTRDGSYDYVLALGGVVSYCGDPAAAIREMARVLAPGGELLADGIHNRLSVAHWIAWQGDLDALERLAYSPDPGHARNAAVLPEELEAMARQAGLVDVHIWSEFAFMPDDEIRIGPETGRWERVVLDLEMRHHADPRFLGAGMLILKATKPRLAAT